jgi:hypothetical protein
MSGEVKPGKPGDGHSRIDDRLEKPPLHHFEGLRLLRADLGVAMSIRGVDAVMGCQVNGPSRVYRLTKRDFIGHSQAPPPRGIPAVYPRRRSIV